MSDFNLRTTLLIAATAALPLLLHAGFLNTRGGGDSPFLLFRLHQLIAALEDGHFPVRWMPDAAYGLGYPFFHYYAALSFYVAAAFKAFGFSYVLALKLTHLLGFLAAAAGMYLWVLRATRSRPAAWLAAAAYTFAPFHFVNVYVRGDSLAEFWALALYPLCLWCAHMLTERPSLTRLLALATSYAALILTHNISALIFSPFLLLYLILQSASRLSGAAEVLPASGDPSASPFGRLRASVGIRLSFAGAALFLGFALSAFFWLPALREQSFAQLGPVTKGYFHYGNHFRSLNLVQATPAFNYDIGSAETTPFAMGLAQTAFAVLGLGALLVQTVRRRHLGRHALFLALGLLISTFMITPLSRSLWDTLPLLPFVQFPWRFLSVQALFTAAITGAIACFWPDNVQRQHSAFSVRRSLLVVSLLLIVLLMGLAAMLRQQLDFVPVADSDVTAKRLQDYEYFTGNIGTTVNFEYLPQWTQPRPYTSEEYLRAAATPRTISGELVAGSRTEREAAAQTWRFEVGSPTATIAVPLLYWPGWSARLNGEPLEIGPIEGLGWTVFELPKGEHVVELRLGPTPVRRIANLVSLLALGLAAFGLLPGLLAAATHAAKRMPSMRVVLTVVAALAGLTFALHLITPRLETRGPATMDFAQLGWLHRAPVQFENGAILRGYNFSGDHLRRGDLLAITTAWRESSPATEVILELVGPGAHLLDLPLTFAQATSESAGEQTALLELPADMPPGVFLVRLRMADGSAALTPSGQRRGDVYLRPVRFDDPGLAPPDAPLATLVPGLELAYLAARQESSAAVTVVPHWQAAGPVNARSVIALRLHSPDGRELAALDTQVGSGLYPTDLWRPGEVVPDPYPLNLPAGLPPGDYPLTFTFYDAATLEPQATATATITLAEWTPRSKDNPPVATLTDWLALQSIHVPAAATAGQALAIRPEWVTLAQPPADVQVQWRLSDGEHTVTTTTSLTPGLSLPEWPVGVLVAQPITLELPADLPSGAYSLDLHLLDLDEAEIADAENLGQVALLSLAEVSAEVTTELPPMDYEAGATFGPIMLAGYDASLGADDLSLTLHWQARAAPEGSYKYFVHIFDTETEAIAAQWDAFPQAGAHPTHEWLPTEVVSESVLFPLADLEPDVTYNIAVGWYDPDTGERLPARSVEDLPLEQERYLLNLALDIPGE